MSRHYVLTCECGSQHEILERNAGETISCECGKQVDIPTLRQIRHLPLAADDHRTESTPSGWSFWHGIAFALAVPTLVIALGIGGLAAIRIRRLPDIQPTLEDVLRQHPDNLIRMQVEKLSPETGYRYWKALRSIRTLSRSSDPPHVTLRKIRQSQMRRVTIASLFGGVSLLIIIGSVVSSALGRR